MNWKKLTILFTAIIIVQVYPRGQVQTHQTPPNTTNTYSLEAKNKKAKKGAKSGYGFKSDRKAPFK